MKYIKNGLLGLITLCLISCATPYQKVTAFTMSGGYYDEKLPTGEYKVGFGGNGYTSTTLAMDYTLLRCANIAIENNKDFFEIVQGGGGRKDDAYWNGYGISYASKPSVEYIIRLHDSEPEKPEGKVFNAVDTKNLIKKRNSLDDSYRVQK